MASRKSNNAYYRSADLAKPFGHIKEAMGLTGNADSNYYTNLGKVSRYEGSELDNRKKEQQAALILEALASTTDPVKRAGLGHMTNFTDSGTGELAWQKIPSAVALGESKAAEAESKAGVAEMIRSLAEQISRHGEDAPDIANYDTSNPNEMRPYGDAIKQSAGDFEELVRKLRAVSGKGDAHKTEEQQESLVTSKIGATDALTKLRDAQTEGYKNLNVAKVNQVLKTTDKVIAQTKVLQDLGTEKINQIRQKVLDHVNLNIEKITNLKDMNRLINERILTEGQRLRGEGFKADTAELIAGAKGGELYLNKRQLELKLKTLKEKLSEAKSDAQIASLNQEYAKTLKQYEVETKKQNTLKATSQAGSAKSKANIAGKDEAVHDQKLKDLQKQRTNLIEKGKVLLANARTDGERKKLAFEIDKELRPIEKQIKELAVEQAEVNIKSKSRESLTKTPSPSQLSRQAENLQARTDASNRSKSGSSSGDTTAEMIKKLQAGGATPSPTTTTATPRKGTGADPVAMEIFNSLMSTVEPEVLRTWTPEETDKAVAMIKQKHPNMNEERIRRLIQTAQRRSQQ